MEQQLQQDRDDFADFEQTLQKIDQILKGEPETDDDPPKAKTAEDFEHIDVDKVKLKVREDRTVINKRSAEPASPYTPDQQGFMREVERDANERAQARAKREYEAELQRSHGNEAFRNGNFEKAILHYSKAIERVKNSAITYNNRALCFIRLRNYKRAIDDCQYVLDKLQESNLRAWLYKATAHKRQNDAELFEECVNQARLHNPQQLAYIDKFIGQIDDKI
ncbi:PREDICTED: tetratricopeptide repeat protein 12 [Drosophila arizonae]|uniref:Tetratricopeptide repeat protein 12 n=1 Tax=Drosophila arizonae TaxID=7263 RepID=A0ABM1Q2T4_DROAR|nr:PREDICTED: tetratricopeptide repeat protein 12 [Drosophila arizonae]